MPKWESNSVAKIHETCGGLVRWVEAYDDPHVGYTGECLECGKSGIVVEDIIPIELDGGEIAPDLINRVRLQKRRGLRWDEDLSWEVNQERLAEKI